MEGLVYSEKEFNSIRLYFKYNCFCNCNFTSINYAVAKYIGFDLFWQYNLVIIKVKQVQYKICL